MFESVQNVAVLIFVYEEASLFSSLNSVFTDCPAKESFLQDFYKIMQDLVGHFILLKKCLTRS